MLSLDFSVLLFSVTSMDGQQCVGQKKREEIGSSITHVIISLVWRLLTQLSEQCIGQ